MGLQMLDSGTMELMKSDAWVGVYAAPDSTHSSTLEIIKDKQAGKKSVGAKIEQPIECSISSCFT
jgi:hypothetical protein